MGRLCAKLRPGNIDGAAGAVDEMAVRMAYAALAVETTPGGIRTLAEMPNVRAVMEDQPISLISK